MSGSQGFRSSPSWSVLLVLQPSRLLWAQWCCLLPEAGHGQHWASPSPTLPTGDSSHHHSCPYQSLCFPLMTLYICISPLGSCPHYCAAKEGLRPGERSWSPQLVTWVIESKPSFPALQSHWSACADTPPLEHMYHLHVCGRTHFFPHLQARLQPSSCLCRPCPKQAQAPFTFYRLVCTIAILMLLENTYE